MNPVLKTVVSIVITCAKLGFDQSTGFHSAEKWHLRMEACTQPIKYCKAPTRS
jgi:hypothetical protein